MASALSGLEGWLFLADDDANRSVSQFKGQLTVSPADRLKWRAYHRELAKLAAEVRCKHAFLIAPSKESIYTEYHPDRDEADFAVGRYLSAFPESIYQRDLLRSPSNPFPTYSKTNTHWNDWGAYVSIGTHLPGVTARFQRSRSRTSSLSPDTSGT